MLRTHVQRFALVHVQVTWMNDYAFLSVFPARP